MAQWLMDQTLATTWRSSSDDRWPQKAARSPVDKKKKDGFCLRMVRRAWNFRPTFSALLRALLGSKTEPVPTPPFPPPPTMKSSLVGATVSCHTTLGKESDGARDLDGALLSVCPDYVTLRVLAVPVSAPQEQDGYINRIASCRSGNAWSSDFSVGGPQVCHSTKFGHSLRAGRWLCIVHWGNQDRRMLPQPQLREPGVWKGN